MSEPRRRELLPMMMSVSGAASCGVRRSILDLHQGALKECGITGAGATSANVTAD
jgi:hypothetical protein